MGFRYRKRLALTPPGLRWLVSVHVNVTQRQARGDAPSVSVKLLGFATWNSRRRTWWVDLPGGAHWQQDARSSGHGRLASPHAVAGLLALAGVPVAGVLAVVAGLAWQAAQAVAR